MRQRTAETRMLENAHSQLFRRDNLGVRAGGIRMAGEE